ncbi:uncharacterized protein LOC116775793 isoform X1 [Danaus plexippus]|uniref:uncharacterized protein LOC116775793 isoform X1 n=1 Tax=Danaus plexippus TaxID=13037 RepID=UPI0013C5334B|nr:uncharacterized protein LOC116775793 isoform X1 [Danaus plexippus]
MLKAVLCVLFFVEIGQIDGGALVPRWKRDESGVLNILTNHAQPIHADVKGDNEKPCFKVYLGIPPSNIEDGTVFQVVPPKDVLYEGRSLRKSLPLNSRLDLVRAISRVVTLLVLLFSAAVEFYPVFYQLYNIMYEFIYFSKY